MSDLFGLGTGITITTGFDLTTQKPLDSRTVVNTLEELRALPASMVYKGLLVHVVNEDKLYQWKKSIDNKGQVVIDKNGNPVYDWGPIEAEVSAMTPVLSEINFASTPSMLMQNNKSGFFPVVNEKFVYDDNKTKLSDKYQTKSDNALNSIAGSNGTVVGSITVINGKLDAEIQKFRDEMNTVLADLRKTVGDMEGEINDTVDELNELIDTSIENMNKQIDDMNEEFEQKLANMDLDNRLTQLENSIKQEISANISNVNLSATDISGLMTKVNANITLLNSI